MSTETDPADHTAQAPSGSGEGRSRALFQALIASLPGESRTVEVTVGLHWTGVVVARGGRTQCGLASTWVAPRAHGEGPDIGPAGQLGDRAPEQLVELIYAASPTERAVGLAAINACLDHAPDSWEETSAAQAIVRRGAGERVALIGHFPFIADIRQDVGELIVFELEPQPGELRSAAAPEVLPTCSVVAITGTTLINGTFGDLMNAVAPDAYVILLGPSSPMSSLLFEHGIDLVAGTQVTRIQPVMRAIREGANYRQIHRLGTHLVTLSAPGG